MKIVCPKCESQNSFDILDLGEFNLKCPSCSKEFQSIVVKIRAKKSRQNKSDNRRDFDIRVFVDDGNETMISFANSGIEDIEFRSGDMAVFSYFKGKLKIAQNLTIGQYSPISSPLCFLASRLFGPNSYETRILRSWRDYYLDDTPHGRFLISTYYRLSPVLLKVVPNNRIAQAALRAAIRPVVNLASRQSKVRR